MHESQLVFASFSMGSSILLAISISLNRPYSWEIPLVKKEPLFTVK